MSDFEGLMEEARANSGANRRRSCGVSDFLQSLPGEDADKVEDVLNDRAVSAAAIHIALRRRVGDKAPTQYLIGVHRRKACSCFSDNLRGVELK